MFHVCLIQFSLSMSDYVLVLLMYIDSEYLSMHKSMLICEETDTKSLFYNLL